MMKITSRSMLLTVMSLVGCSDPAPTPTSAPAAQSSAPSAPAKYQPETFRTDVEKLISSKRYADAIALVEAADASRQVAVDGGEGYVAVAMDMILLPGVYPETEYNPARDWVLPGTGDVIDDMGWQRAAEAFAERYNRRRIAVKGR